MSHSSGSNESSQKPSSETTEASVELPALPLEERIAVFWSFYWRFSLVGFALWIVGSFVSSFVGMGMRAGGASPQGVMVVSLVIGLAMSAIGFYFGLDWTIKSKLGNYRVQLIRVVPQKKDAASE